MLAPGFTRQQQLAHLIALTAAWFQVAPPHTIDITDRLLTIVLLAEKGITFMVIIADA